MPNLKSANEIELNERRAESSLMNALVSSFAFFEPSVWFNGMDVKCPKIPAVNPHTIEGLAHAIIDLPVDSGVYDMHDLTQSVLSYLNSSNFYRYVTDKKCEDYHTAQVIISAYLAFSASTFLRLGRYPRSNEMLDLRNALRIPDSLTDTCFLVSYIWIAMHERGWFHQDDIEELELSLSLIVDSHLLTKFFHHVISTLDVIRQTAKSSKVKTIVHDVLNEVPEDAKASYAMMLTSVADLSEHTGSFYDTGFNIRYQRERDLQISYDLGYYAQDTRENE